MMRLGKAGEMVTPTGQVWSGTWLPYREPKQATVSATYSQAKR